jgi:hypothetical protein
MVGTKRALSLKTFPNWPRACASNVDDGAPAEEVKVESEEEREDPDESETIDSGEERFESELAREERRMTYLWGEVIVGTDQRPGLEISLLLLLLPAWARAKLIEDIFPRGQDATFTAGVPSPLLWGVKRGVGSKPSAGAKRFDDDTDVGVGSRTLGASKSWLKEPARSFGGVNKAREACGNRSSHGVVGPEFP